MLHTSAGKAKLQHDMQLKLESDDYLADSPPETLWDHLKNIVLQTAQK